MKVVEVAADAAGELTGLHFVHLGASVIKVEPPGGTDARWRGPFAGGTPDPDLSLAHWCYNGGKRSVEIDLTTAPGHEEFEAVLDGADVLISTLHPRELRALGWDLGEMAR
jgi:crotonobetainyl-CoA:carnitine CoA-transferase CaiB-like acyl-CoA transferase